MAIGAKRKVEAGAKAGRGAKNGEARRYGARGADRAGEHENVRRQKRAIRAGRAGRNKKDPESACAEKVTTMHCYGGRCNVMAWQAEREWGAECVMKKEGGVRKKAENPG